MALKNIDYPAAAVYQWKIKIILWQGSFKYYVSKGEEESIAYIGLRETPVYNRPKHE